MFIRGVFGEQFAVGGALEGLKAGLALDGEGGHVLLAVSAYSRHYSAKIERWTYGFQLALRNACACFRSVALTLLLSSAEMSASRPVSL